jgi:hypothetical protein
MGYNSQGTAIHNFLLKQRDWTAYDSLVQAETEIKFLTPGKIVYIIPDDTFYYWDGITWQLLPGTLKYEVVATPGQTDFNPGFDITDTSPIFVDGKLQVLDSYSIVANHVIFIIPMAGGEVVTIFNI